MNNYKTVFNLILPSETSVERILEMTEKRRFSFKPMLITAVIIMLLTASFVSVNAVTDGAIVNEIKETISAVKIFINGEEKGENDINYTQTDEEDGEHHSFEVADKEFEIIVEENALTIKEEDGTFVEAYGEGPQGGTYTRVEKANDGSEKITKIEIATDDGFNAKVNADNQQVEIDIPED